MKTIRTYPKYAIIDVRGLLVIYLLLCVLSIFFSRIFFSEILYGTSTPEYFTLFVFLTIPGVLLLFFIISILNLLRDLIGRQIGSGFHLRLLAYFTLIVAFAATPSAIVTSLSAREIMHLWRSTDITNVITFVEEFAITAYSSHLEHFGDLIYENNLDSEEIVGIQDFRLKDEVWLSENFQGEERLSLDSPPSLQTGFAVREMPRDRDVIRYCFYLSPVHLKVVIFSLGIGFDNAIESIKNEKERFEAIDNVVGNAKSIFVLYYGIFFFPILLMTLIIALSFTQKITEPIVELTEATRQVAGGDFSIYIKTRPKDELGVLVSSFNIMVRDLEKTQKSLVKAQKISIWQTMAEQLAHEVKNPLTPIKLSAERVLRRWQRNPDRVGEIIEKSMLAIIQEVEGLSNMLTEFRTFSRSEVSSNSVTKVWEVIEEIVSPYKASHPNVEISTQYLRPDASVKIDRQRFSQIITNLVTNGIDAMGGKGFIEIRADFVKKRENRFCRLSIKDTGKGIKESEKGKIFSPYFTTKKSGTGLGLAIVERIVNEHSGNIWFNSEEGVGTTFFIDLPSAD